jgi:hypothetical protein
MKHFFVKFLILVSILPFTPVKEIIKAPLLLIHYMEHIEQFPDMTVAEFFNLHYKHGIHLDVDHKQDRKLPFKSMDYTQLPLFIFPEKSVFKIMQWEVGYDKEDRISTNYRFFIKDPIVQGIFHPPQTSAIV